MKTLNRNMKAFESIKLNEKENIVKNTITVMHKPLLKLL